MKDKLAYYILFLIFIVCALLFIISISFRFSGSLIRSDGISYYTYLRSLVFDKDVNHYNEFIYFGYTPGITPTGFTHNLTTIGTALLWLPFYLVAHLIVIVMHGVGISVSMDGYSFPYQFSVCMGTIIYVSLAFFLIYKVCRRYFSVFSSILAVVGIWLAANPIYYTIVEPSMSQGVQLFTTALFMYIWLPIRFRTYKDWLLIGMTMGMMALVHCQSLIFISVLIVEGFYVITKSIKDRRGVLFQRYFYGLLIAACMAFFVFIPQMIAWKAMFGSFIANPYPYHLNYQHPKFLQYLFSPGCGLFTWTPVIFLSILGFIPLYKKNRNISVCLFVTLLIQWYFYSSIGSWPGSYGARHFVSSTPLFVVGLAALIEFIMRRVRYGLWGTVSVLAILIVWNFLFILQYSLKFIPHNGSISWKELIYGKFLMIKELVVYLGTHI